jgi:hypothetical protein
MVTEAEGEGEWFLESAFDRHAEAHWFLHQLNEQYHKARPFRFSLNAVLRALKEVPDVAQAAVKDQPDFASFYKPMLTELRADPVYRKFADDRNFIVHTGMLLPVSEVQAGLGVVRSAGFVPKISWPFGARPQDDSDEIMARCVELSRKDEVFAGLFSPQDDDQIPCVWRTWRLTSFPEEEVRQVVARTWKRVGALLVAFLNHVGNEHPIDFENMPCLAGHLDPRWTWKTYPQSLYDPSERKSGDDPGE